MAINQSVTETIKQIFIGDRAHYIFTLPPHGAHEIGEPDILEPPKKSWRCVHCGRPNWLTRLTCESCGGPKGEL